MEKDFNDLLDIKVNLDGEIAIFRNLIEGEEDRLGLSQQGSPATPQTGRGIKRKRTYIDEEDVTQVYF
jgi:hypothetical protein